MEKEIEPDFRQLISTRSAEAYKYYMYANQAFYKLDFPTAREWYLKAIDIDTNFTEAIRMLTYTYVNQGMIEEAKKSNLRLHRKKDQMSIQEKICADVLYSDYFETPYERIKYLGLLIDLDDQMPVPYFQMAAAYRSLHQYEKAISLCEKELEIYNKWGSKPRWSLSYVQLGILYHLTGQYRKEKKLYEKAERDFPDDYNLLFRQAILSLTERDTSTANLYIEQFISACRISSASEAAIASDLAGIYSEADIPDKAEEYLRKALSLEPEAPGRMNNLAWTLIDNDQNITEGMELIDKALQSSPDDYIYLDTKGWGLYKQGKYEEALEILEKSWDLKPRHYDHELYLHIEEVKKAIANQKNN
jgi:tetratricopeptide (TPR) repeat protein